MTERQSVTTKSWLGQNPKEVRRGACGLCGSDENEVEH